MYIYMCLELPAYNDTRAKILHFTRFSLRDTFNFPTRDRLTVACNSALALLFPASLRASRSRCEGGKRPRITRRK